MKILAVSDKIVPFIYGPQVRRRFQDVDLILGCGDLAYYYLEFILSILDVPLYFVRGNHDKVVEYSSEGQRTAPHGGQDLHGRLLYEQGLLIAGVQGCLRYRPGQFQYSQMEMWQYVLKLTPGLVYNRARHGRYLDIFVTHAPSAGIHDDDDLPHQGIKAFRWLVTVFQPAYHFHGHVHLYRPDDKVATQVGRTQVINAFGFQEVQLNLPGAKVARAQSRTGI
jgi:Icc-related predicted phosphoesterase